VLQRAFELARSGTCRDLVELEMKLKQEGFEQVSARIGEPSVRRQLSAFISARFRR
jgi:hypothetical protein